MSFAYNFSRTPGGNNEWTNQRVLPVYDGTYAPPPQMFPQGYMAIHPPSSRQSYTPPQNGSPNQFQMFSQFQPQFQPPLQHQQYALSSSSPTPSSQPPSDSQHFSSQIPPQSQQQPSKSPFSSSSPSPAAASASPSSSQGQHSPKVSSPPPSSAPAPTAAATPSSTAAASSSAPSQKPSGAPSAADPSSSSSSSSSASTGSANRSGSPDHHHHQKASAEGEDSERISSEAEHERGEEAFEGGEEGVDGEEEGEEVVIKLLVPNSMVGSIIGKGGATIKEITVQTNAKIHIAQGDESSPERMVTITGTLANASVAQFQISLRMLEEAFAEFKDVEADLPLEQRISLLPLKLVIPNSVVGRLIGKGGTNLKRTMAETDTFITCSKEEDFPRFVGERVVSIIGNIKNQRRAQNAIMQQIRQYVQSQPSSTPSSSTPSSSSAHLQGSMNGSAPGATKSQDKSSEGSSSAPLSSSSRPSSTSQTSSSSSSSSKPPASSAAASSSNSLPRIPPELQEQEETLCVMVSNSLIGAIIGKKGATVKEIGTRSGCSIRVARNDEVDATVTTRPITLFGSIESLFRAQSMIYSKLQEAPSAANSGIEQPLRVHITIPNEVVGRVIGKKGSQVKKITEMSGAKITINQDEEDEANGTVVYIVGNLESNLTAQIRIFEILSYHSGDQGN